MEIMASEGFDCKIVRKGKFIAQVKQENGVRVEEELAGIDFIRCSRKDVGGIRDDLVTTIWSVALILSPNCEVEAVAFRQQFIGL